MKSILVHADHSPAFAARRDSALALARHMGGHVTLLINTPFQRFVAMDPFGGAYLAAEALADAQARDAALAERISADLAGEDVLWDLVTSDDDLVTALAGAGALADLTVVSLTDPAQSRYDPLPLLAGDLALAARVPVLALPCGGGALDLAAPALVAWNGSAEAATALRLAVPLLRGRAVTLLRVGSDQGRFPDTTAAKYLARHAIKAELCEKAPGALSVEEVIEDTALSLGAGLLVMGAFGHSRLRETLFGGVTRYLLTSGKLPLLLAH